MFRRANGCGWKQALPKWCCALVVVWISLSYLSACGGGGGGSGEFQVELVLGDQQFPVKLAFAPDGRLFFTELATGAVRVFANEVLQEKPFAVVQVPAGSGSGLTGLALDPNFADNGFVYFYHTDRSPLQNKIVRFTDIDGVGSNPTVIVDQILEGGHNGGALRFSPDGTLYLGTGDSGLPSLSQDSSSLSGKILRINSDGSVPTDNPEPGSLVFAQGFRNVFGLDFNPMSGALLVSDNGPSCDDELNLVVAGGNYGWREDQPCGDQSAEFIQPLIRINPSVGPTDVIFYTGFEFPELRGQMLYAEFNTGAIRTFRLNSTSTKVIAQGMLFSGGLGGVLGLAIDSSGRIYFSTPDAIYRLTR